MHELATVAFKPARKDDLLLQNSKKSRLTVIRCPECGGLRGCLKGHERRQPGRCKECRSGRVVKRADFWAFWLASFTEDEIDEMARAIWG